MEEKNNNFLHDIIKDLSKEELIDILISVGKGDLLLESKVFLLSKNKHDFIGLKNILISFEDSRKYHVLLGYELVSNYIDFCSILDQFKISFYALLKLNITTIDNMGYYYGFDDLKQDCEDEDDFEDDYYGYDYEDEDEYQCECRNNYDRIFEKKAELTEKYSNKISEIKEIIINDSCLISEIIKFIQTIIDSKVIASIHENKNVLFDLKQYCFNTDFKHFYIELLNKTLKDFKTMYKSSSYMFYIVKLTSEIIFEYDNKEEAIKFLKPYSDFDYFLKIIVDYLMDENQFDEVITLVNKRLHSTTFDLYNADKIEWFNYLIEANIKLGNKSEIRRLAVKSFRLGKTNFYPDFKKTFNENEFDEFIKNELIALKGYKVYPAILIDINDYDQLLEYLRISNINKLIDYAESFPDKYQNELIKIFKKCFGVLIEECKNSRDYEGLKQYTSFFINLFGLDEYELLKSQLLSTYIKRRSLYKYL